MKPLLFDVLEREMLRLWRNTAVNNEEIHYFTGGISRLVVTLQSFNMFMEEFIDEL